MPVTEKNLLITDFLVKFCFIQKSDIKIWNLASSKIRILRSFKSKKILRLFWSEDRNFTKSQDSPGPRPPWPRPRPQKNGFKDYITGLSKQSCLKMTSFLFLPINLNLSQTFSATLFSGVVVCTEISASSHWDPATAEFVWIAADDVHLPCFLHLTPFSGQN